MLPQLKEFVPWEKFRRDLEVIYDHEHKSNAGRRPFDVVMMFKILILQSLYNLSDDEMEYQIMDRLSFMRFLDMALDSRVSDAKTIWLFRSKLEEHKLTRKLFDKFNAFLAESGFVAKKGQIVDATYAPSEPHGEEEEGFFRVGIYPKDECRRAMMTARRHFPLHNNGPELIDYFASPLGISKSICPAGVEFKRGRTSSSHLRKQIPFALHVAANEYRIARRCPPASLPAKRQFFRMIAIPLLSRSAGLLSMFNRASFRNFLSSSSMFNALRDGLRDR